eukprot:CAMPEP_0198284546 /NCGR_PEP_ID=MMETSP1449-20131203/4001_1 /TAXON_ID=420275 /ORGANISM="Attheya septentrionalis, Strain CCMP2084" /LENGTH=692 /DNA_ID=CAMNT_0043981653 /DNA_START=135 /DNA_END=2210 /DNA_ORIENTATION=-
MLGRAAIRSPSLRARRVSSHHRDFSNASRKIRLLVRPRCDKLVDKANNNRSNAVVTGTLGRDIPHEHNIHSTQEISPELVHLHDTASPVATSSMDAHFNTIPISGILPKNPPWGTIDIHNSLATQHSHSNHTKYLGERTNLYSAIKSQVPLFIHKRSLDGHIKKSHVAVRYLSTSSGGPNNGNGKTSAEENSNDKKIAKEEPTDASEEGKTSRLSAVVGSVGQRLPHLQWHVPDLVSVYGIFMLIAAIVVTPIVFTQMKKSDSKYDEVSVDDTVSFVGETMRDDVLPDVRLASHDIRKQRGMIEEDEDMDNKSDGRILDNTVDLAADFIKSKILQDAITHLVTSIIQSDEFKNACQTLLKTLWNDLINDPETTAQVVQLLNNAIQDDEIKAAVQDLVKQLIADEQVYAEFTKLLVRLASEEEVLASTQALLTESTHKALNDPEILDHSMEFATDVVGDDVVQRTSGEALRNTVTYAVRPGVSVVFAIAGAAFVVLSLSVLWGMVGSAGTGATAAGTAIASTARSFQTSSVDILTTLFDIPGRVAAFSASAVTSLVLVPVRLLGYILNGIRAAGHFTFNVTGTGLSAIGALPHVILDATRGLGGVICNVVIGGLSRTKSGVSSALSALVGCLGTAVRSFVGSIAWLVSQFGTLVVDFFASCGNGVLKVGGTAGKAVGSTVSSIASFYYAILTW